jgi:hypothetical protein
VHLLHAKVTVRNCDSGLTLMNSSETCTASADVMPRSAHHTECGFANRSLTRIEPVCGMPKRKLENREQRFAAQSYQSGAEMQKIAVWRRGLAHLTRGNVGSSHTPGNNTAETGLAGWGERTRTRKRRFENIIEIGTGGRVGTSQLSEIGKSSEGIVRLKADSITAISRYSGYDPHARRSCRHAFGQDATNYLKRLKPGLGLPRSKRPKVKVPDDPQQRSTLIIQLALIAAIITVIAIVAVSR